MSAVAMFEGLQQELSALKIGLAEIDLKLAASRAEWIQGRGPGLTQGERAELDCRRATMNLKRLQVLAEIDAIKSAANKERGKSMLRLLCLMLEERGMSSLIEDAKAQAVGQFPYV